MLKLQKDIDCKLAADMRDMIIADASKDTDVKLTVKITKFASDEYDRFIAYEERYLARTSKNVADGIRNFEEKSLIFERGVADRPPSIPTSPELLKLGSIFQLFEYGPSTYYNDRFKECVLFMHIKLQKNYSYELLKTLQSR